MERAAALIRRLADAFPPHSTELREAHSLYVEALFKQLIGTRSEARLKSLQRWFEIEMRPKGIFPTALTYAHLLKATLHVLQGPKMERTIRRYMDLAQRSNQALEVLKSSVLTDADLFKITQACPDDFYPSVDDSDSTQMLPTSPILNKADIEVRPMAQSGLGLSTLKKSVSIFTDSEIAYPEDERGAAEEKDYVGALLRQERLEADALSSAVERWRKDSETMQKLGLNPALNTKYLGALLWDWHRALMTILKEELGAPDRHENTKADTISSQDQELYAPVLRALSEEKLASIAILSTMSLLTTKGLGGMKLSSLIMHVGTSVRDESLAEFFLKEKDITPGEGPSIALRRKKLARVVKNRSTRDTLARLFKYAETKSGSAKGNMLTWTATMKAKIGAILVSALLRTAKIPVHDKPNMALSDLLHVQPAFFHTYQYLHGRRYGFIKANSHLVNQLQKAPGQAVLAKHLPMVVRPKKWTSYSEGGYLQTRVPVMRLKAGDVNQRQYVQAATEKGDMDQVFAGLDVLAKTAWTINRPVFHVMLEAWNSGEEIGGIPPENPEFEYPQEPAQSSDPLCRPNWIKAIKQIENKKNSLHSQRCFQNLQLEIARAYLNERFYFPHNVDFRGRAYPIPPYLNHMGADNCRGLLQFAEGKMLGASGLTWLKIHLANVFGFDKASFTERQDFTMRHLSDVKDSATYPLNGKRWWLKAEDPWQCLAACFELKDALESQDPEKHVSHLAIHQDGTCNGLQHYAALGGDVWGAKQVNLEPGDRPSDIYTAVSELVVKEITKDAARGNPLAAVLDGKVKRKVVKQTVMTNVYGVTFIGATAQVRRQLEDILPDFQASATVNLRSLSSYVAGKIFRVLSTMFKGAHDIQYWLGECANRISTSLTPEQINAIGKTQRKEARVSSKSSKSNIDLYEFTSSVIWTTPLKMPVVQPYRTNKARSVMTTLQRISILEPRESDPVNKRKQLQGFPPNFIHSLDATHMLLSALKSDKIGLTFAAVHDSFWTHAANVDQMNRVLRDAFVDIHTEDVVVRLAAEFRARYDGCIYLTTVSSNSPIGKDILAWRKKNSSNSGRVNELLRERERMELLGSSDPLLRAKGRSIVTPGSLYEAQQSPFGILESRGIQGLGIGEVGGTPQNMAEAQAAVGFVEQQENQQRLYDENVAIEIPDNIIPNESTKLFTHLDGKEALGSRKLIQIWLPISFPPVPKKGEFNVSRLQQSQYFFS
ncbi:MAG: hypothetical protein M1825_004347 [Sarcosagium campestre]|nr:MAG: hypothetical protein M1825_004347 [Sarcosagium campestre]